MTPSQKLLRLQSLLFNAEASFDNGDKEKSKGFYLQLIGFIQSLSGSIEESIYLESIRAQCYSKIVSINNALSFDDVIMERAGILKDFKFKPKSSSLVNIHELLKTMEPFQLLFKERTHFKPNSNCFKRKSENLQVSHKDEKSKQVSHSSSFQIIPDQRRHASMIAFTNSYPSIPSPSPSSLPSPLPSIHGNPSLPPWSSYGLHDSQANSSPYSSLAEKAMDVKTNGVNKKDPILVESDGDGDDDEEDEGGDEDENNEFENNNKRRKRNSHSYSRCGISFPKQRGIPFSSFSQESKMKEEETVPSSFLTAREKMAMDSFRKGGNANLQKLNQNQYQNQNQNAFKDQAYLPPRSSAGSLGTKCLGLSKRNVRSNFVSPFRSSPSSFNQGEQSHPSGNNTLRSMAPKNAQSDDSADKIIQMFGDENGELPERLKNLDSRLIEHITNEIMTRNTNTTWKDIAGLDHAKRCVTELIIWPLKRPDLFRGTRSPANGLLLYGPPGTGKTLIGRAIAGESNATFFSISASSLTSKWIGEGEKLVRSLFGVASCLQPAVIFIDEIDSILSQRKSDGEHESSRRLKTEFLIQMEGCGSGNEQILLIGATNRPQELDEAARRRMSKRLYIPLPETVARAEIVSTMLAKDNLLSLSKNDIEIIAEDTKGYSGSDMKNLVKEASMAPLREAMMNSDINQLNKDDLRPISLQDFKQAIKRVRPSVAQSELRVYEEWSKQFGSGDLT